MQADDNRPPFDLERAAAMVGKYALIGLTCFDHKGTFIEQRQLHGIVRRVDSHHGIAVELLGERAGETYWLPPDLRPWRDAEPGEYRLRSTGEVVVDPDFFCRWTIEMPEPNPP